MVALMFEFFLKDVLITIKIYYCDLKQFILFFLFSETAIEVAVSEKKNFEFKFFNIIFTF